MTRDDATAQAQEWHAKSYADDLPDNISSFRELLEKYGNVAPERVDDHLRSIRDKAWAIHKYPCIGRWHFTNLRGLDHPAFQAIVERLKRPDSQDAFLDVGCCLGQALRKMAFQGVDPARLYGTDLSQDFLDLGFELFNDREKFGSENFIAADMLEPNDERTKILDGKVTIIHAANFLHLFDWDRQVMAVTRMIKFLKPGVTDAMVLGGQLGSATPGHFSSITGAKRFWHDPETFQKLWDEAGRNTGTTWKASAGWITVSKVEIVGLPDEVRYFGFVVRQVDGTVTDL